MSWGNAPAAPPAPGGPASPPVGGPAGRTVDWQRLHPLTPIVSAGRGLVLLVLYAAEGSLHDNGGGTMVELIVVLSITGLAVVAGLVRWLVTRWALDGPTLRIETGLLRRDARQLPVARIQAVDVLRPFLARLFGLAELRVRLAGNSRANGRIAYLPEAVALDLRARLLAGHHGLDVSTPEPAEQPVTSVPLGALIGSVLLSSQTFFGLGYLVLVGVLTAVSPAIAAGFGGGFLAYLLGFISVNWRRVSELYGFTVGVAPDGIRVKRGLFSTVSETVPFERVQAVRRLEPLPWRLLGWCRLEVDVAGSPGQEQGTRSGRSTKALLPVGDVEVARTLFVSLLGLREFALAPPPRRAIWKTPLRYHFLAGGHDGRVVAASYGRARRVTTWVPLEKVQSVRRVQGPVQRRFGLATVHVDAAGRRVSADLHDRDVAEADRLVDELVTLSRQARQHASRRAAARGHGALTPGMGSPATATATATPAPATPTPGMGMPGVPVDQFPAGTRPIDGELRVTDQGSPPSGGGDGAGQALGQPVPPPPT